MEFSNAESKPLFSMEEAAPTDSSLDVNHKEQSQQSTSVYAATTNWSGSVDDNIPGDGAISAHEVTPVCLVWKHLTVVAENPRRGMWWRKRTAGDGQPRFILKDVSGAARPGTLTAILGASGSGKSALLNALTSRSDDSLTVTGQILANGYEFDTSLRRISAYVQQNDFFLDWLKVKEHLLFQASVRMDNSVSSEVLLQRVEEVLRAVGLTGCSKTIIGNPSRGISGISGGERKRLAFASEILTNPSLMFCDEPTTGLDSFMAHTVVTSLKNLASEGRTVLCTIHQPSSEIYSLFDRLILVAEGAIAFQGSTRDALAFFDSLGYCCPSNYNPADFFIRTLAFRSMDEEMCKKRVQKITQAYTMSSHFKDIFDKTLTDVREVVGLLDGSNGANKSHYPASWWRQFSACVKRAHLNNMRDPLTSKIRLVQTIVLGLVLGLVFFQETVNQTGIQNINGVLFLLVSNSAFANTFTTVQVMPPEMTLMKREYQSGLYRVDAWYLAKFVTELPVHMMLLPILLMTIPYWMIGLYPSLVSFLTACLVSCLSTGAAISFAYLLSAISRSVSMALAIAPPMAFGFMLLGGLFINVGDIPVWMAWISYLSWFRFGFEALLINEWSNIDNIDCAQNATTPCVENGEMVLEAFSFSQGHFSRDLYTLAILLLGFRLLAFTVLLFRCKRRNGPKRRRDIKNDAHDP